MVLAVQVADGARFGRRRDARVAVAAQQALEQEHVHRRIVDDEDARVLYIVRTDHVSVAVRSLWRSRCAARSSADASVSRNSGTFTGFVRYRKKPALTPRSTSR